MVVVLLLVSLRMLCGCCFFFKQKTAYEMRISDWSSDVCSSDLATGALWSRTAEPRAGEPGHGEHPRLCLNCGAALIGDFCHECGQAGHVHRSLAAILHDLAHGVLHFEGKIWRKIGRAHV